MLADLTMQLNHCTEEKTKRKFTNVNEAFVALTRARVWCVAAGLEASIFDELRQAIQQYSNFVFPTFNKTTIERNNDKNDESLKDLEEAKD